LARQRIGEATNSTPRHFRSSTRKFAYFFTIKAKQIYAQNCYGGVDQDLMWIKQGCLDHRQQSAHFCTTYAF
jgi:hypothetical protein